MRPDNSPATPKKKRKPRGNSVVVLPDLALDEAEITDEALADLNLPDQVMRALRAGKNPTYCLSLATHDEVLRLAASLQKQIDVFSLANLLIDVHTKNGLLKIITSPNESARDRMSAMRLAAELNDRFPKKTVEKTVSLRLDPDTLAHLDRMAGIVDAPAIPLEAHALLEHGENTDAEEAA